MQAGGYDLALLQWLLLSIGVVFASSFDGFMVGIAYSIMGLRISRVHYCIMAFCTATMMGASMIVGRLLAMWLTKDLSTYTGAVILILVGSWQIQQQSQASSRQDSTEKSNLYDAKNRGLTRMFQSESVLSGCCSQQSEFQEPCVVGLAEIIIDIMKEPLKADQDLSGTIDIREAWLLSVALGLDAFAAGLGASAAGFPLIVIPIAALASPLFVFLGMSVARITKANKNLRGKQILPGVVLIAVGILKIFGCF